MMLKHFTVLNFSTRYRDNFLDRTCVYQTKVIYDVFIEMTSWISNSVAKKKVVPEPVSYFPLGEGTFKEKTLEPTFVTAYYDIFPGNSVSHLKAFCKNAPYQIVLFTDAKGRKFFDTSGTRVTVYTVERKDWVANVKYISNFWNQQVKQDPEVRLGRTLEQLQFLYEKKEFLKFACKQNPFGSTDFVWVDPLSLSQISHLLPEYQTADIIPTDRILVQNPQPFKPDDIASSYFRGKKRVDNSILAGPKELWLTYAKLYDDVIEKKQKTSEFVGDDLIMLHHIILYKPELFCLVKPQ